jgi:hypothetical protein
VEEQREALIARFEARTTGKMYNLGKFYVSLMKAALVAHLSVLLGVGVITGLTATKLSWAVQGLVLGVIIYALSMMAVAAIILYYVLSRRGIKLSEYIQVPRNQIDKLNENLLNTRLE